MTDHSRIIEPPFFPFPAVRTAAFDSLTAGDVPPAKLISITGKTVLMAGLHNHYQRSRPRCLWIALDDRDISVDHVLRYFEALLTTSVQGIDLRGIWAAS